MLMALNERNAVVNIAEAQFPAPFKSSLEYSPPARGTWNIVHVGMLVPESHQIYAAAQACLRGVVLTAAEMGCMERFSTIAVEEKNLIDGKIDALIIDGVSDILEKLPKRPKAVLLFTTCIHNFIGCDLNFVYSELRKKFPDVDFADCYMNLIMRKTVGQAEPLLRKQMYTLLKPETKVKSVNILGNVKALPESCELVQMLENAGYEIKDVCSCKTYEEFQSMGGSVANISTMPYSDSGNLALSERLGQKALILPLCFDYAKIENSLRLAAETLGCEMPDVEKLKEEAEKEALETKKIVKDMPVETDYTAVPLPLEFAEYLLAHGFNVTGVYGNVFAEGDRAAFERLKKSAPQLKIYSTLNPAAQFLPHGERNVLAVGQKAAFFNRTPHFVNIVEGAGLCGFDGIIRLLREMCDAAENEKDINLIQIKGWGCGCCEAG